MPTETKVLRGVSVDGTRDTKLKHLFRRIGGFFNPPKDKISPTSKTSDILPMGSNTQLVSDNVSSVNNSSANQLADIVTGVGAITNIVFGFLGQSQQTKQSKYQLEAMNKQKEIALLQGEVEYNIQKLEADIELKKQELIAAQKADTTKNIIKLAIIFGVLFFLGFVIFLGFKRQDTQ